MRLGGNTHRKKEFIHGSCSYLPSIAVATDQESQQERRRAVKVSRTISGLGLRCIGLSQLAPDLRQLIATLSALRSDPAIQTSAGPITVAYLPEYAVFLVI